MKSESAPITDDECLLRRVRVEMFCTADNPFISPNAFAPRTSGRDVDVDVDVDGLSLYREACQQSPTDVLATVASDRLHEYGVVRIRASLLKELGLTIKISRDDRIPGHVVIPEMNAVDYKKEKAAFTPIKSALAREASKDENILIRPQPKT
ncbi:MAG: hypothetical protein ACRC1K_21040 [Planctomycetia bacterium]